MLKFAHLLAIFIPGCLLNPVDKEYTALSTMDPISSVFRNVWLADDDKDDSDLFADVLKQILPTSTLCVFKNGEELMDRLSPAAKPDILFLDINMPCKDGMDCLVEIRAQRHFSRLPIVIFSSSKESKYINTSYSYGANLYYTKPSSFQDLIAGLGNLFNMNWNDPFTITSDHYVNHGYIAYDALGRK